MKNILKRNRVLNNASWIVGCKIVQAMLSFFIGTITARYLGPSNYGLINYAASLVAFFTPIMQLGLNETLVHEFLDNPEESGKILGTSLILNISASIASIIGLCTFSAAINGSNSVTTLICGLYSLNLFFQATEMTMYWFQSKLMSKYTSIASLLAHFLGAIYKAYLLISGKSVVWFALTHTIEACAISMILLILFKKYSKQKMVFSWKLGKQLFSRSRHYIISGLMIVVFQQTDKVMLQFMLNSAEVGYYSSAISCMAVTGFVFSAVIDSSRPWVLEGKQTSDSVFSERIKVVFSITILISLIQSVGMTIFANPIISILFGQRYLPATKVLRVAVWYIAFGYMGSIRNIWILANYQQKYLPIVNLSGAVLNVFANFLLIPKYGAVGAAVASFVTQFFANFVLCFAIKPIREVGVIMVESINPRIIVGMIRSLLRSD